MSSIFKPQTAETAALHTEAPSTPQQPAPVLPCPVCNVIDTRRSVQCRSCLLRLHTACLGLHPTAYPAGEFVCASCTLLANKIESPAETAVQAAHMLVYLSGHRVACSSMDTYAAAMHRFVHFCTVQCGKPIEDVLPQGQLGVVDAGLVQLFISYAATKYKLSTIRVTLSALVDWHKSKGAAHDHVSPSNLRLKGLLQSVAVQQGPAGLPQGKQGMSKRVLFLLLRYIREQQTRDSQMMEIYVRDWAMISLGFYGFLRRSELIRLTVADITFVDSGPDPYISLYIRRSKSDQTGAGAHVHIVQTTQDGLQIGQGVRALVQLRLSSGAAPTDPLFPAWDLDKYSLKISTPLTNGQALATRLKMYSQALLAKYPSIHINPSAYGMHSLRRGGVVAAWEQGVDIERIKAHGRWRISVVNAYMTPSLAVHLSITAAI